MLRLLSSTSRVEDPAAEVESLREAERARLRGPYLRAAAIVAVCAFIYVTIYAAFIWYWCAAMLAAIGIYRWLLFHPEATRSANMRVAVIASTLTNFFIASCFPIYLFSLGQPLFQFVGVAIMSGLALHNIARHSDTPRVLFGNAGMVCFAMLLMGLLLLLSESSTWNRAAIVLICTVGAAIYYSICVRYVAESRRALSESEARYFQAKKMEAIGHLTGGIAHDFNNLLTVISGNLDLHDELSAPQEKAAALQAARRAAVSAAKITSELMAFSRKSNLQKTRVALDDFFADFQAFVAPVIPSSVRFEVSVEPGLPELLVDREKLKTALLNLCLNSVDAMPDGGSLQATVKAYHLALPLLRDDDYELPAGQYCKIAVHDTGHGVPDHYRLSVMEPFFTTKEVGEGSGLGLSMVNGFVEQSAGILRFFSSVVPGKSGTRVEMLLPFG